jgi:hypothetical protein
MHRTHWLCAACLDHQQQCKEVAMTWFVRWFGGERSEDFDSYDGAIDFADELRSEDDVEIFSDDSED